MNKNENFMKIFSGNWEEEEKQQQRDKEEEEILKLYES